jgi:hypothetical protein
MKTEAFFLFLIILLGLILCSFLGGDCSSNIEGLKNKSSDASLNQTNTDDSFVSGTYDNYDHYSGSSSQFTNNTVFIGPNGNTASIVTNSDGTQIIKITKPNNSTPIIFVSGANSKTFTASNGASAKIVHNNGNTAIKVTSSSGKTALYTITGSQQSTNNTTSTQYYGSTGTPIQEANYSLAYQPNNYNSQATASAGAVTGPNGNTAYYAQGPQGNIYAGTTSSAPTYNYSSSLPQGIPASLIPPGQENLYILKSEVVPPVCPACPSSSACPRQEKCPPCPACARCPEPSFECKKVPNYNAIQNEYLPVPVLNDFSSFGM